MKYIFMKLEEEKILAGSSWLCRIYDDFKKDVYALGQLKTLFGEPLYITENLENQFSYWILATDEEGNTYYLNAYCASSGPAIGGPASAKEAANALAEYIREAEASDYDYEGYYLDGPCKVRMGIQNGQPYEESEELILSSEELMELYQRI